MAVWRFIKRNVVFLVAVFAALATGFFIPPDRDYLTYFDWSTLACLFLTLSVICALRNIKFFSIMARRLVLITGNLRSLFMMLVFITFVGSMLIANDMALITFLPLSYFALHAAEKDNYMAYLFIIQNIAANLGGMLTPFGNPQNLYLYSFYRIPTLEFCGIMLYPFLLAITMLIIACLFVKPEKLSIKDDLTEQLNTKLTVLYLILFASSLLIVFRIIPFWVGLIIIPAILLFTDKKALLMVDYPLLGTFFFFFIFTGNTARIDVVNSLISSLLKKDSLIVSAISCQVISNVPTALLLSRFTTDYRSLLIGVNIGGTGTLIASLASLITFNEYRSIYPTKTKQYLLYFTLINVLFLVIMLIASKLFFL